MAENKTHYTEENVKKFVLGLADKQQLEDSNALIQLMENVSAAKAKMFGTSIIGFGTYQYQYASGHKGEAPLLGFSPRKAAISLYVYTAGTKQEMLLSQLGKFKMGKACIYIKRLSDINVSVLKQIMESTVEFLAEKYSRIN